MIRAKGDGWDDVERTAYKESGGAFLGVARHTLLGGRDSDDALGFEVRYFEVDPGGHSSLERHRHA
ncbi:MAG: cupin domain-containing protein, partial [Actinobacteria bacterium]|nr:cupin domain-containing protein [Actinomycetota bacterium]NIS32323.1 cupin domain-containing protein [Actinomycetota bacterium]NIU67353.1 cupin domain-containing protein [Actinomycetota bacterium]NIV87854.1 cupin domain-containing protein [Actinomycetota bacterium]NIW29132.1 cupin domain-containing protein [Actinomycetota bacterium]